MHISPSVRKVFEGVATRHEMHRMFNRHRGNPAIAEGEAQRLFAGEWFEIAESEHDYMLDILPPLWMRGDMFAMREFMTGSVTSIFFALAIDGKRRWFHGYCDLSDRRSPDRMKAAIIERESRPVRAMTRDERLEHIWSSTHDDYRGYAGERWPQAIRGRRTVLVYAGQSGTVLKLLDDLTEAEIAAKLPVQFRHLPETVSRKLARQDGAIETLRARCAPESRPPHDDPERVHRKDECLGPADCRPRKRHGAAAYRAEADLAVRSGERLEHSAELGSAGSNLSKFSATRPDPVGSPLGFAAVCAAGGPLQGQVASDQRPPISARPGRVRRRAPASWTLLVRSRALLAWRSPDLEAALIPAALGDRTRREVRQGPDRADGETR